MDDLETKKIQFLKTKDWLLLIALFLLCVGVIIAFKYKVMPEIEVQTAIESTDAGSAAAGE